MSRMKRAFRLKSPSSARNATLNLTSLVGLSSRCVVGGSHRSAMITGGTRVGSEYVGGASKQPAAHVMGMTNSEKRAKRSTKGNARLAAVAAALGSFCSPKGSDNRVAGDPKRSPLSYVALMPAARSLPHYDPPGCRPPPRTCCHRVLAYSALVASRTRSATAGLELQSAARPPGASRPQVETP